MRNSWLFYIVLLFAIVSISGCIQTGKTDVTLAVKALPQVQEFLEKYPDAEIKAAFWSKEDVEKEIESINESCGKEIEAKPMWKAEVKKENLKLIVWLDSNQNPLCIYIKSEAKEQGTEGQTTKTKELVGQAPTGATFLIKSCTISTTISGTTATIVLENTGTKDLNNFTVMCLDSTGDTVTTASISANMAVGVIKKMDVTCPATTARVRVRSIDYIGVESERDCTREREISGKIDPKYCSSDDDCVCYDGCSCINKEFRGKLACTQIIQPCETGEEVCACIEGQCKSVKVVTTQKT